MASRKLRVDMRAILDAMTFLSSRDEYRAYMDLQTGTIVTAPLVLSGISKEEKADAEAVHAHPEQYEEVPTFEGHAEYRLMTQFAEGVAEADIREKLTGALQGKGAFGRFRGVIQRFSDLQAEWEGVRQEALIETAQAWLRALEIEAEYELPPTPKPRPVEAPRPAPLAKPVNVGLLDLLLLGGPDGKTEVVEGQIRRQLRMRGTGEARGAFKQFARELCQFFGWEWRNRYIEGKSSFDIERAHLRVDGTLVELAIDVDPGVAKAFS